MKIATILPYLFLFFAIPSFSQKKPIELAFNEEGTFKIVQFTDVHYVLDSKESKKSLQMINQTLKEERPDLVVFTGDIITCKPQKEGWDEVLAPVVSKKIPYAIVLGNHDDEHDWTREQIMDYLMKRPYSLVQKGPDHIKGYGNYILKIKDNNNRISALLYLMDSNAYNKIEDNSGYDWFDHDQVEWYRKSSSYYTKLNQGNPYPALAFFHIPLQEYSLLQDPAKEYVKVSPLFGNRIEKECPGLLNTGMFSAMVEAGDVMSTFVGHDHDNDYIGYMNGICLAYGRFSGSKTTYTNLGYGARVIELKQNQRTFDSWIRTSDNKVEYRVTYPDSFVSKK